MSEWLKKKKEQVKRFLLKDRGLYIPDPIKTTKPVMDKLAGINTRPISSKAKTTVGKIAGGIVETPFTFLTSVPKFYGQTMNDITSGRIKTKQGQKKTAGLALETALDTASVGLFGKAKAVSKGAKPASQTLVSLIRKSAKKGAKIGTGYGAGYGLSQGLQENRDTKSLISSTLKSGVIGGITGGGLGWGVPSGSALFKAGKHDLNVKLGKSYGKPKIVPGFERINGKLFYGRRVDPNAPQFKKTLKDVISTIPRPGMSLETVKGKGRIPVSDIRKFSKQPKKTIGWKETQLNATVNDNLNPFFKEGQLSREIEAGKMKTAKLFKELFEAKNGGKLSAAEETRRVRELNEVIKRLAPRQAESGRALNIQKKKVNFDFEDKDLDQLVKENPKLKTVVDFIKKNKERDPDFIDKLIEYRTAGLLSGIKTVVRNVIGNTTATALKFPEKAVAGGLDAIYSKVTGKPRQIFAGEAVEDFKGIFSKNSAGKNFINALKNEDFSTMSRLGELPKMKAIKGKAGKIIRIPYRMANAPDEFFRTANIAGEKRAMAYREYKKKDLAGLFNKQPKKTADPLHKEARKYKSAEEFVKAQGTPVYRTEKADIAYKGKSVWGDGKYFGIDKNQVKEMTMSPHSGKSTGGKVDEYLIPSNLKIKEINIGWDAMKPKDFNNFPRGNDLKKQILNEGYDGVILKTDGDLNLGGDQLIMYKNADQIKTKSQLTDIWNKANTGGKPTFEEFLKNYSPRGEQADEITNKALERTFQNKSQFASKLNNMTREGAGRLLRIPLPFTKTPINIGKFITKRTPLGFLNPTLYKKDIPRSVKIEELAKTITGTAGLAGLYGLAKSGAIQGSAPNNPGERDAFYRQGKLDYSVKIGDKYHSLKNIDPISTNVGIAADLAKYTESKDPDEAKKAAFSVLSNITNQSYLTGLRNWIEFATDEEKRNLQYLISNEAGSFAPTIFAHLAQWLDPEMKQTDNRSARGAAVEGFASRIPFASMAVRPKRDLWGNPTEIKGNFFDKMISPTRSSEMTKDPVEIEMARIKVTPGMPAKTIRDYKMSADEYDHYVEISGKMLKQKLDKLVSMDEYKSLKASEKQDLVQSYVDKSRLYARAKMVSEMTQGMSRDQLKSKLSELKKKGFLTKEVYNIFVNNYQ